MISFPNLLLGTNKVSPAFSGQYFTDFAESLGSYTFLFSKTLGATYSDNYININITDLGTSMLSSTYPFRFGNTIKGSYNGTVYLPRQTSLVFDIPVQMSIDFKAVRMD